MFLVKDERFRTPWLVFTYKDPRKDGYKGSVEDGVTRDYDRSLVDTWKDGEDLPENAVGKDPANPKHYKIFWYTRDLQTAGYTLVPGMAFTFASWLDYLKLRLDPPNPDQIDEEDWYNYLDKLDEESRRLRKRTPWPEAPKSPNRDDVAAWVAKQHFITDISIREIWYLPQGAPDDEIRFLELNERLPGDPSKVEPIDFGLEVRGAHFRLFVADVSGDQLEQLKQDSARLPAGWHVGGHLVWRRRPA
jgi:hypothetical protein